MVNVMISIRPAPILSSPEPQSIARTGQSLRSQLGKCIQLCSDKSSTTTGQNGNDKVVLGGYYATLRLVLCSKISTSIVFVLKNLQM